jgi:hypothetical protein
LLEDGWRPVRETPLGRGQWLVGTPKKPQLLEFPLVLILLKKDGEEATW